MAPKKQQQIKGKEERDCGCGCCLGGAQKKDKRSQLPVKKHKK